MRDMWCTGERPKYEMMIAIYNFSHYETLHLELLIRKVKCLM